MTSSDEKPEMQLVRLRIDQLTLDPRNMRMHNADNINAIKASLKRWGQQRAILIDGNRVVKCGNGTVEAAKQLGWTAIDCTISDLHGEELAAYAIADNRCAELATWNDELGSVLAALHEKLPDLPTEELGLLDFSTELPPPPPAPGLGGGKQWEISLSEAQGKWSTALGQLWGLGRHRLLIGEARDPACVERLFGGLVPGIMVTDQPYGVDYDPEWRDRALTESVATRATNRITNDDQSDWSEAFKLFPGNIAYVWHAGMCVSETERALEKASFIKRAHITWIKDNCPIGRGHYSWKHESCWYAIRKGKTAEWCGGVGQSTVWQIENVQQEKYEFSTRKPIDCMERPIRNHAPSVVYDPFVGSGTTIIAAENVGKTCVAMELEPSHAALAIERWLLETGTAPVAL